MVDLGGRPLIARPLAAARAAGLDAVVVAKRGTELPDVPTWHEPDEPSHPLLGLITALEHGPVVAVACDQPWLTPELGRRVRHRGIRIEAPERVRPGGSLDIAAALAQLEAARAELLRAFAAANRESLDVFTYPHPVFGPLTLRSWVSVTADHEARHSAQVVEIAEQLAAAAA